MYSILLTSLLNALQLRIVFNPTEKISWVELLQWRTMKLHIIPWIYLLLTEWLSMNQYIPLMDRNSSTKNIYERYLGSVAVFTMYYHWTIMVPSSRVRSLHYYMYLWSSAVSYSRQYHIASSYSSLEALIWWLIYEEWYNSSDLRYVNNISVTVEWQLCDDWCLCCLDDDCSIHHETIIVI